MSNGWSPERRLRQAELIQLWRPWEQSTGPKTTAGKHRTRMNAVTHGQTSQVAIEEMHSLRNLLRVCTLSLPDAN